MTTSASTLLPVNPTLGVALAVLLVAGAAVAALARLGHARAIAAAGLRATVQLAAVAVVVRWAFGSRPLLFAFVAVMFAVATWTAGRRIIGNGNRAWWWAAVPIGVAVFPVVLLLVAIGLLPVKGIALIPVTGIFIGGALTATVLAGRRALEELETRHGEVEAALSLGFPDREARLEIARQSAAGALIPALDQTRTVGLVTLPGAFIGMLLGGASPLMAGAVQLFVLVALLAVEAVAVAVVLELVARNRISRPPRGT
ncbi:ABC transporter permease [Streptomyces sp. SD31]|uniref:ABC transporter permease n=1 Tax=Streptomyces sp. SD31 TaxID=3452208 RepID=UPI003F895955